MFDTLNKRTMVCNLVNVLLVLVLLVMQFLPFWHYEGEDIDANKLEGEVSIQKYIWLIEDKQFRASDRYFENVLYKEYGEKIDFDANKNDLATGPALFFVLGVLGMALCFFKNDNRFVSIIPAVAAAANLYGYLTQTMLQMNPIWIVHAILSVLIIVTTVLTFILGAKENA